MQILSVLAAVFMSIAALFGWGHMSSPMMNDTQTSTSTAAAPTNAGPSSPTTSASSNTNTNLNVNAAVNAPPATLPAGSAWQTSLPLGDSKYVTSGPKQGYIYLCHVQSGGQGAQGNPTWIHGSTWDPSEKVAVEGSVAWQQATYSMTISGDMRIIKSNGLPTDHDTGVFPIAKSDPAYQFDANPNSIEAQNYDFEMPADPTEAASPDCIYGEVGIMNDGVPLFDGFDAEYRDAVAHETQDAWDGHPDQTGVYHDHGFEDSVVQNTSISTVVGFAFDGFPITGGKLPDGKYLTTSDLDECHGIVSAITLDGKSVTTYHYVLTQDFPYSVSCFRGTSYEPKPGGSSSSQGGMQMGAQTNMNMGQGTQSGSGNPPVPPQAAIDACAGLSSGASCTVSGGPSGICTIIGGETACKPN